MQSTPVWPKALFPASRALPASDSNELRQANSARDQVLPQPLPRHHWGWEKRKIWVAPINHGLMR